MKGSQSRAVEPVGLRIIGGMLRGRRLQYGGDQRVRPMKDRVRESVFHLLEAIVADRANGEPDESHDDGRLAGYVAVDLFSGTGALGLEAISRGAGSALFIERHLPTMKFIAENARELDVAERCEIVFGDAFLESLWRGKLPIDLAWCVFCCPPYEFFHIRRAELLGLIRSLQTIAPTGSLLVVESDDTFDLSLLPDADRWTIRRYPPAVVAVITVETNAGWSESEG